MSMSKFALLFAVTATACLAAQAGYAQNKRTFVSNAGLSGNTAAGCSASSPCDTFAHALSVTNTSGEINCLNAGEFGTVTITKAITINCGATSNGGITANGVDGITVDTTGPVILIGLDINGMNAGGGSGVFIQSNGSVNIRHCKIRGFQQNNANNGNGILFMTSSSGGNVVVDNVLVADNTIGIEQYTGGGASNMTVRNSNINNNEIGIEAANHGGGAGGPHTGVTIEQTTMAFNSDFGLIVDGQGSVGLIGGSTAVNNNTGVANTSNGVLYSFKNNQIGGNATDISNAAPNSGAISTTLDIYPGGPLN